MLYILLLCSVMCGVGDSILTPMLRVLSWCLFFGGYSLGCELSCFFCVWALTILSSLVSILVSWPRCSMLCLSLCGLGCWVVPCALWLVWCVVILFFEHMSYGGSFALVLSFLVGFCHICFYVPCALRSNILIMPSLLFQQPWWDKNVLNKLHDLSHKALKSKSMSLVPVRKAGCPGGPGWPGSPGKPVSPVIPG